MVTRKNKPTKDPHCKKCGSLKEGSYAKESMCKTCMCEYRKQKRLEKRLASGKKPRATNGSGRSPFCSKCGKEKDDSFKTSGYCRECKAASNKKKRAERRQSKGLPKLGSAKEERLKAVASGKVFLCSACGNPKEDGRYSYCYSCKNEKERSRYAHKRKNFNFVLAERKKVNDRYNSDPEFKRKKDVHTLTNSAIRMGLLQRKPCEVCREQKVDAHHDDYAKPLDVRWLCRKHHNEHHRREYMKQNELKDWAYL